MNEQSSNRRARLRFLERVTTYGPLAVTVVILLVQTFAPGQIDRLPLTATSAIIAGSILLLIWHVESKLLNAGDAVESMIQRVTALEEAQTTFIRSTMAMSQSALGTAFGSVAAEVTRIGHLRIYAISSQQILSFFKHHNMVVDRCQILLRGFDPHDATHRDFLVQIRLVVADWRRLQVSGRIGTLEIRHYDFFPTEYECMFDKSHLVLGLYDSEPTDYSGVRVRDPILIKGVSDGARAMIAEFTDRFDRLFATCAVHHGSNVID